MPPMEDEWEEDHVGSPVAWSSRKPYTQAGPDPGPQSEPEPEPELSVAVAAPPWVALYSLCITAQYSRVNSYCVPKHVSA